VLVGQLLGVDLDGQAVLLGGLENLLCLRRGKGDVLAEYVDCFGQSFGSDGRDHHRADFIDVSLRFVTWRYRMRTEESGYHFDVAQHAQLARHAQLFALIG